MSVQKLYIEPKFPKNSDFIDHTSRVFLIGSCFSENIFRHLAERKFQVFSNPYGILFDTLSIERCLEDIACSKVYSEDDLFFYNELYGAWNLHSSFSSTSPAKVCESINSRIFDARNYLQTTSHVFITLGSAFSYYSTNDARWVANCHKIPQVHFQKELISVEKILKSLYQIEDYLLRLNPTIQICLTISPVRHLRDGLIENNRSKSRLIEAVYQYISSRNKSYYFPSYEIIIDVLRDYRFFDIDFAHPNYLATEIVFDYFKELCIDKKCYVDMESFYQLHIAKHHRSKHPDTKEHCHFLETYLDKSKAYAANHPHLDFKEEIAFFEKELLKVRS